MTAAKTAYSAPATDLLEILPGHTILEASPLGLPDTVWVDEVEIP